MMAASSARSAELDFEKARRTVEKSILLNKPGSQQDIAQVDQFMTTLADSMKEAKKRLAKASGFNEDIDSILPMAEDRHKAAVAYLKPRGRRRGQAAAADSL